MMAGLGPGRPKVRIAAVLRERGEEETILQFLHHIPREQLNWWDVIAVAQWTTSPPDMVQIEFVRGIHYWTESATLSLLRDGAPRVAQALEQRARMAWEDDDRAIRGQLTPGEPVPLIYGWNA